MQTPQPAESAALDWKSLQWPDGARFEGLLKGDKQHVLGVMTFPNKDRYEGQWVDGQMDGYGVYVWKNGTIYRGDWVQGRMHGCGVRMFKGPDGAVKAVEGRFFSDEYVGPILPCSSQECLDVAVEADVAAAQARAYRRSNMQQQTPPALLGSRSSSFSSQQQQQQPASGLIPGLPDPAAEQRLSSLVQQLAMDQAARMRQQQGAAGQR